MILSSCDTPGCKSLQFPGRHSNPSGNPKTLIIEVPSNIFVVIIYLLTSSSVSNVTSKVPSVINRFAPTTALPVMPPSLPPINNSALVTGSPFSNSIVPENHVMLVSGISSPSSELHEKQKDITKPNRNNLEYFIRMSFVK